MEDAHHRDAHHRYEQLAVGHVLGGLDAVDAAEFRSHLISCRHCRMRVAELRGIASDLAAAEREERVAARVQTEVARREEEDDERSERGGQLSHRVLATIGTVAVLFGVALLVWNFHLREVNSTLLEATAAREQVLSMLASGEPVEVDLWQGIEGLAAVDDGEVALDLAGLPAVGAERWLAVWLVSGGPPHRYEAFGATAVQDGRFAAHLRHYGADRIVVSLEERPTEERGVPQEPGGLILLEADLP